MKKVFRESLAFGTAVLGFLILIWSVSAVTINAPGDDPEVQGEMNITSKYGVGGGGGGGGGYAIVVNQTSPACASALAYYSTIQSAINDVNSGSTIHVCSGTYNENVDVNKSVNLKGAGIDLKIVNATNSSDYVFEVIADNVVISGFTVKAGVIADSGIYVITDYNKISNNFINSTSTGIKIESSSSYNLINNNEITSGEYGIFLEGDSNSLKNNVIYNTETGIVLFSSDYNTILENNINGTQKGISNVISNNNTFTNNTLAGNEYGVFIDSSYDNKVIGNYFTDNLEGGVFLSPEVSNSDRNRIMHNSISSGKYGIYLSEFTSFLMNTSSNYNVIVNNNISNHSIAGTVISNLSSNNTIYHNNFINNTEQALNNGNNAWDNGYPSGGNYWSDYDESGEGCDDANSDGFCDSPYNISGWSNYDRYPFVNESGWIDNYPIITIYSPQNNSVFYQPNITIKGYAFSDEVINYRCFGNSYALLVWRICIPIPSPSKNYSINTNFTLGEGLNTISLTYKDVVERSSSVTLYYTYEKPFVVNQTTACLDGKKYFSTIQDSINDANSGDTIYVCAGTYNENVDVNKSVNLIGAGADVTIVNASNSSNSALKVSNANGTNISGFNFVGSEVSGIYLNNSHYIGVENVNSSNNGGGIYGRRATHNVISDSTFNNNSLTGINLQYNSSFNVLARNVVNKNGNSGISISPIPWIESNILVNNTINDNDGEGISLFSGVNHTIINNTLSNNKGIGLYLTHGATHSRIINNTFNKNRDGIWFGYNDNSNNITGNIISDNIQTGISSYTSNNNTYKNNFINGSDAGISLKYSHDNLIHNNTLDSDGQTGIYSSNSDNNTYRNNTISFSDAGILLKKSHYNSIQSNTIYGTSIYGAISLDHANNYNTIEYNLLYSNSRGLWFTNDSNGYPANNTIRNNTFSLNNYGTYFTNVSTNTLYHNNFINNANQAYDNGNNTWDNGYPSGGNYWRDYDESSEGCNDNNSDGFCDSPYNISGGSNRDKYPFTVKDEWLPTCTYSIEWLPPISLDRSFNKGSTVPIKFNVTTGGSFVSDDNVSVEVFDENGTEIFNATTEKGKGKGPAFVKIDPDDGLYKVNMHTNKSWADGNYSVRVSTSGRCKLKRQISIEKKGAIHHREISNGSKVKVNFSNGITITFDNVTEDGDVIPVEYEENPGGALPSNFKAVGAFYDITTTAGHKGDINMCIPDDGVTSRSRLYHWDGAEWDDVTTSVDGANHVICGTVSSLSPFGIFEKVEVESSQAPSSGGGGSGSSKPKIVLLANSIDYGLSSSFTAFLKSSGINIIYTSPENFSSFKNQKFIVILGGPDAPGGVGSIVKEVLSLSEQEEIRAPYAKKMHLKENVWKSYYNQIVFVIAGSDRGKTKDSSEEHKEDLKGDIRV